MPDIFFFHRVCMVKEPEDKRPKLIVFIRILFQFFFVCVALLLFVFFFFFLLLQFIFHSSELRCIFFMVTIRFEWLLILENYLFGSWAHRGDSKTKWTSPYNNGAWKVINFSFFFLLLCPFRWFNYVLVLVKDCFELCALLEMSGYFRNG